MKKITWHRVRFDDIEDREEQGPIPLLTSLADMVYIGDPVTKYPRLHISIIGSSLGYSRPSGVHVSVAYKGNADDWWTSSSGGIPVELIDDFIVTLQRVQCALVKYGPPRDHVDVVDEVNKTTTRTFPDHERIWQEVENQR